MRLYDRPQNDDDAHGQGETYAVWMPYQFEQALRALQPKPSPSGRLGLVQLRRLDDGSIDTARAVGQDA